MANLAPTICEDCERTFQGGPNAFFCPECRYRRTAKAARENAKCRGLNKLGNAAYSEQRAIAKAMMGQ